MIEIKKQLTNLGGNERTQLAGLIHVPLAIEYGLSDSSHDKLGNFHLSAIAVHRSVVRFDHQKSHVNLLFSHQARGIRRAERQARGGLQGLPTFIRWAPSCTAHPSASPLHNYR